MFFISCINYGFLKLNGSLRCFAIWYLRLCYILLCRMIYFQFLKYLKILLKCSIKNSLFEILKCFLIFVLLIFRMMVRMMVREQLKTSKI